VYLKAAEGAPAAKALEDAGVIWSAYQLALAPVLEARATPEQMAEAVGFARANNVKLLGLMNGLTTALEVNASQRATNLRMVQAAGILLALLNFAYILYKFLSSLRRADNAILEANEENAEILGSVREGLFLLYGDLTLGTQISASVKTLLGRQAVPGDSLLELLQLLLFDKDLTDAREYLQLLFSPHVRENLVQNINPLTSVEVNLTGARGVEERKYLSFSFNRVMDGATVRHLLVTMQDITPRMVLEKQLDAERSRARKEFSSLVQALKADSDTLRQFVERAEVQLLQVNDLLRSVSEVTGNAETRKVIDQVFRLIHAFKGEASALDLELLAGLANQFEDGLQTLRNAPQITGESLLNLPLPLENLLEKITLFRQITRAQAPRVPWRPVPTMAPTPATRWRPCTRWPKPWHATWASRSKPRSCLRTRPARRC
jgi:HPt (histidine-containing phosphotransfer) domain-containing protein